MKDALASGIYEGMVRHRRVSPRRHEFRMPVYMLYLDLSEVDRVFAGSRLWSVDGPAALEFRRSDYLGRAGSLDGAVRALIEERTGRAARGPIRLLTNGRCFGWCFNPVSFYYCFDARGERVETIVAEITNTPWNERHAHVLAASASVGAGAALRFRFAKEFHVSPFMGMEQDYDWSFRAPEGEAGAIGVHMVNFEGGRRVFDATLAVRRREATAAELRRAMVRFPAMSAAVFGRIYFEAARLWLKRVPVFGHPGGGRRTEGAAA